MIYPPAEARYREGRERLAHGHAREALPLFKEAIELDRAHGDADACGQGRYHSYYGLCLCITRTSMRDALHACRTGATLEPNHPHVWWNLGKVALTLHRRGEAHRAWTRGLELDPEHDGMRRDLAKLGIRRTPVLSWVPRRHPLNVALGVARARLGGAPPRRSARSPGLRP